MTVSRPSVDYYKRFLDIGKIGPKDFAATNPVVTVDSSIDSLTIITASTSETEGDASQPLVLPKDALAAQLAFYQKSTRYFIIYGRGQWDYAVTPNSIVGLMLTECRSHIVKLWPGGNVSRPFSEKKQAELAASAMVQTFFEYYEAAGKLANVPPQDVARQFEAEWGVSPLKCRTEKENDPNYRVAYDAYKEEVHKSATLPLNAMLYRNAPSARPMIQLDGDGIPVYDVRKNSRFVLVITQVNKRTGEECGDLDRHCLYPGIDE